MKKFFILSALVVSINGYAQVQLFNGSEYSRTPIGKAIAFNIYTLIEGNSPYTIT